MYTGIVGLPKEDLKQTPTLEFARNYNKLLKLARSVSGMSPLLPPEIPIVEEKRNRRSYFRVTTNYGEMLGYVTEIVNLLE